MLNIVERLRSSALYSPFISNYSIIVIYILDIKDIMLYICDKQE